MADVFTLGQDAVTSVAVRLVAQGHFQVAIAPTALEDIARARTHVLKAEERGVPVYGLTRQLGSGNGAGIKGDQIAFQRQIIRNHNAGFGRELSAETVRATIFLKLVSFVRGRTLASPELAQAWLNLLNSELVPIVYEDGSIGAADLTQLASIAAVITGTGRARFEGKVLTGVDALEVAGLTPYALQPGEALVSLSSNSYSVGLAATLVEQIKDVLAGFNSVADFSSYAIALADPGLLHTPLSFRTHSQAHAALTSRVVGFVHSVNEQLSNPRENPEVIPEKGDISPNGNFYILDLALAADSLRQALFIAASASERRQAVLASYQAPARRNGETVVPGVLTYGSANLQAKLRHLAFPVAGESTPLSEGIEDAATQAPLALQLLVQSLEATRIILANEGLLAAEVALLNSDGTVAEADLGVHLRAIVATTATINEKIQNAWTRIVDSAHD